MDNVINIEFSPEEVKTISESIAKLNEVLSSKLASITSQERSKYGRIADKNKVLVDKAKIYMEQAPDTIPPMVSKAAFDKDYASRTSVELMLKQLSLIVEGLKDTKTLLDYDNFNDTLVYYRYIKFLAQNNHKGAKSIYQDMKKHYGSGTKKTADTSEKTKPSSEE